MVIVPKSAELKTIFLMPKMRPGRHTKLVAVVEKLFDPRHLTILVVLAVSHDRRLRTAEDRATGRGDRSRGAGVDGLGNAERGVQDDVVVNTQRAREDRVVVDTTPVIAAFWMSSHWPVEVDVRRSVTCTGCRKQTYMFSPWYLIGRMSGEKP
jgi:hypothetical protein